MVEIEQKAQHKAPCALQSDKYCTLCTEAAAPRQTPLTQPGPCHLPRAGVQLLTSQHKLPFSQTPFLFYWMVKEVTVEEDKAELSVPFSP